MRRAARESDDSYHAITMLLRLLLAQLLLVAARAAAEDKPVADKGEPSELFLFCNTTSTCLVRQGALGATSGARVLPPLSPPPPPPPDHPSLHSFPTQACGALRLNEHCRTDGGYQLQTCIVDTADGPHSQGADSQRPLTGKQPLERGAVVKQHSGCKPTCSVSVAQLMLGCAAAAAAALVVIRWRQRQRF